MLICQVTQLLIRLQHEKNENLLYMYTYDNINWIKKFHVLVILVFRTYRSILFFVFNFTYKEIFNMTSTNIHS